MSVLKKKIVRAKELRKQAKQLREVFPPQPQNIELRPPQRIILNAQLTNNIPKKDGFSSAKNIMKNYSTAIIKFALSDLACPSLQSLLDKNRLNLADFREFVNSRKPQANCIKGLRRMLLVEEEDCEQTIRMKEAFKNTSVTFIRCFSANWIYSSQLSDKRTHLNYRFKILRRLNDLNDPLI